MKTQIKGASGAKQKASEAEEVLLVLFAFLVNVRFYFPSTSVFHTVSP